MPISGSNLGLVVPSPRESNFAHGIERALRVLDLAAATRVDAMGVDAPTGNESVGYRCVVSTSPAKDGKFSYGANSLAERGDEGWNFITPTERGAAFRVYSTPDEAFFFWNGKNWQAESNAKLGYQITEQMFLDLKRQLDNLESKLGKQVHPDALADQLKELTDTIADVHSDLDGAVNVLNTHRSQVQTTISEILKAQISQNETTVALHAAHARHDDSVDGLRKAVDTIAAKHVPVVPPPYNDAFVRQRIDAVADQQDADVERLGKHAEELDKSIDALFRAIHRIDGQAGANIAEAMPQPSVDVAPLLIPVAEISDRDVLLPEQSLRNFPENVYGENFIIQEADISRMVFRRHNRFLTASDTFIISEDKQGASVSLNGPVLVIGGEEIAKGIGYSLAQALPWVKFIGTTTLQAAYGETGQVVGEARAHSVLDHWPSEVTPGREDAEYLSVPDKPGESADGTRQALNPFSQDGKFDIRFYLERFRMEKPSLIVLSLDTSDTVQGFATALADLLDNIKVILPDAAVVVATHYAHPANWVSSVASIVSNATEVVKRYPDYTVFAGHAVISYPGYAVLSNKEDAPLEYSVFGRMEYGRALARHIRAYLLRKDK